MTTPALAQRVHEALVQLRARPDTFLEVKAHVCMITNSQHVGYRHIEYEVVQSLIQTGWVQLQREDKGTRFYQVVKKER